MFATVMILFGGKRVHAHIFGVTNSGPTVPNFGPEYTSTCPGMVHTISQPEFGDGI